MTFTFVDKKLIEIETYEFHKNSPTHNRRRSYWLRKLRKLQGNPTATQHCGFKNNNKYVTCGKYIWTANETELLLLNFNSKINNVFALYFSWSLEKP